MTPDRYDPEREVTAEFIARVADWIGASGEVLVILRYLRAAGSKDYAFCHTIQEFESLVDAAPIGTDIEAFRRPQLPIRGIVTESFIAEALGAIADGMEYMVVAQDRQSGSVLCSYGRFGDDHEDLRGDLENLEGRAVALGPCPDFNAPDGDDLISASKGGIDGPR
jgi:hypothetical protein